MPYNAAPGEQAPSEEAKRKADAAKRFIENMYKMQSQNSRERRERYEDHTPRVLNCSASSFIGSTRRMLGTVGLSNDVHI